MSQPNVGGGWPLELQYQGLRWRFEPGRRVLIGRERRADVVVPIADVSRRHAEAFYDGDAWVIRDLNSGNGLWIDGRRVPSLRVTRPITFSLGGNPQSARITAVRADAAPLPASPPGAGAQRTGSLPAQPVAPSAATGSQQVRRAQPPVVLPSAPTGSQPVVPPRQASGALAPGPVAGKPVSGPPVAPANTVLAGGQVASAQRREVGQGAVTIGRSRDNMIAVDDMLASRHHARLMPDGHGGFEVQDLGSANGTFVNGRAIRQGHVGPGDVVTVGKRHFAVDRGALVEIVESSRVSFAAEQISYDLPDGKRLLDNVQFELAPSSLTAVIGPSGAGKSTLLRVLTGENRPATGAVFYNGRDLHDNYADVRQRLGVVPQDDVIHRQLTVESALKYAAELRFPDDLDRTSRDRRVAETMRELGLTQHAKTKVDRLSGGQRKRVSVAMELLTQPSLLFLDEPTSGLDPGLDKQVMQLLRELADGDRTVMVITHSVANLGLCDNVLLLAPGGKEAYFGKPDGLLPYFGMKDYADVFEAVAANPDYAGERFRQTHPVRATPPQQQAQQVAPQTPGATPKKKSFLRQLSTLVRRQFKVMVADRTFALFTLLAPVVIGVLTLIIPGHDAFRSWDPMWKPNVDGHSTQEGVTLLVILITGAIFAGLAASARELVGERPIYKREQSVGLRPSSYLCSKLVVLWLVTMVQSALLLLIAAPRRHAPEHTLLPGPGWFGIFVILAATSFAAACLGLLLSSFVTTNDQVMPAMIVLALAALVFTGGLFRVDSAVINQVSWLFPSRWGYGAAAASVDLRSVSPTAADDWLWEHQTGRVVLCFAAMTLQSVVFALITYARVARKQK